MNKDLLQLRLIFRKQMMLEVKSLISYEYLGVAVTDQETSTTIEAVCLYLIYLSAYQLLHLHMKISMPVDHAVREEIFTSNSNFEQYSVDWLVSELV